MSAPILLCTVGGSPQPVISALRMLRPRRVCFLVTEDRPERVQRGSADQIPGILAAAGAPPGGHEVQVVPPDDPDAVFAAASAVLERSGPGPVVVDYTGGTKSMSAGLLQAALGRPGVRVQIMAGERSATDKVRAGTERPFPLRFDATLATRDLERATAFWREFAYGAAADVIAPWLAEDEGRVDDLPAPLAHRLRRTHALSRVFDAWDRFDHADALERLEALGDPPASLEAYLPALRRLAANADRKSGAGRQERWLPPADPLLPLDLWRNAERRARQGRYDDAVARCYRLVEATVQWVLWSERRIDTGGATRAQLGDRRFDRLRRGAEVGTVKLGLEHATDAVRELLPDHWLARLFGRKGTSTPALQRIIEWKEARNQSILAHGFRPLGPSLWEDAVAPSLRQDLVPRLAAEVREQGLSLPQLPCEPVAIGGVGNPAGSRYEMAQEGDESARKPPVDFAKPCRNSLQMKDIWREVGSGERPDE